MYEAGRVRKRHEQDVASVEVRKRLSDCQWTNSLIALEARDNEHSDVHFRVVLGGGILVEEVLTRPVAVIDGEILLR